MTNDTRRRATIWLIPALLTLHNAEEALTFGRYLPSVQAVLPPALESRLSYSALLQALVILSVLAFVLAIAANARPQSSRLLWLLLTLQAAVGVNALGHVTTATLLFHGYGPGLITALFVNVPFTAYVFRSASRRQWVSPRALRATVPAALFLHGPVLLGGLWLASLLTARG